ncbi:MAG: ABC transporter permease [Lachnospirales bacterium]
MKKENILNYLEWLLIIFLGGSFIFLAFNFNALEPWIYETFDINLGNIGSYNVLKLTKQFLVIAFLSCVCSLIIGLFLGLFCLTTLGKEFRPIIEKLATVLSAFPSIAMLRFMVPLMGLGVLPTVTALTVHGVLPIIYSTISGIENIDASYIKVSKCMGMNKTQTMFKVQLPMAIPVIISGLRVAMISCIGGATLASYSGGEGLGVLLSAGMQQYNMVMIMECAILICLLSLLMDKSLLKLERALTHNKK